MNDITEFVDRVTAEFNANVTDDTAEGDLDFVDPRWVPLVRQALELADAVGDYDRNFAFMGMILSFYRQALGFRFPGAILEAAREQAASQYDEAGALAAIVYDVDKDTYVRESVDQEKLASTNAKIAKLIGG